MKRELITPVPTADLLCTDPARTFAEASNHKELTLKTNESRKANDRRNGHILVAVVYIIMTCTLRFWETPRPNGVLIMSILGALAVALAVHSTLHARSLRKELLAIENSKGWSPVELTVLNDEFHEACATVFKAATIAAHATEYWNLYVERTNNGSLHPFAGDETVSKEIARLNNVANEMDALIGRLFWDNEGLAADRKQGKTTPRPNAATLILALETLTQSDEYSLLQRADIWYDHVIASRPNSFFPA